MSQTIYVVVDHQGYVRPYASFKEAERIFEQLIKACKQLQADNETFQYRFSKIQDGYDTIKQFRSRYKNLNGKWVNEWYTLQITTLLP